MTTHLACGSFMTVEELEESGACEDCLAGTTDEEKQAWLDQASDLIAIITGMRIAGRCTLVARPCRDGCRARCGCCHLDSIPLGDPKPTVDEVVIDGDVVPDDEYDLHWGLNGWSLVRLGDGSGPPPSWPSYQKRYLPDTEENTFAIYLTVGVHVDQPIIQAAVIELVCDMATEALGGHPNQLESGIIQAQIGNATVVVDRDRLTRLQTGEIGPALSKLVALFAPTGRQISAVYAPELHDGWSLNLRVPPVTP